MANANRVHVEDFPWIVLVGVLTAAASIFVCCWYGYNLGEDAVATRKEIRDQCIAGNDRACKVYEADYARGLL